MAVSGPPAGSVPAVDGDFELDGELVSEEDVEFGEPDEVRTLPGKIDSGSSPAVPLKSEVTTAALAVAGGALAGAATVAAVRAVGSAATGSRRRSKRRFGRRPKSSEVVASRSFLVDIHLLNR